MRFKISFAELRLMCAIGERQQYDQEYRQDLRSGAEGLDYDPPPLPEFGRAVQRGPSLRRAMSDREQRGLIAMRQLQRQPFPNTAGGGF